jgi:hypothetical protein
MLAIALRLRSLVVVAVVVAIGTTASAAPKKKYYLELNAVLAKSEVKPDVAKLAVPRIEAQVKKAFASDPQLVGKLEDEPDRSKGEAYRKWLARKGIFAADLVTVEVTEASEESQPMEGKPNSQRLVVHVALHMLGEVIPDRTMGFTGDGQATIKLELGVKIRDKDREYAWDQAAEAAVADAMKTVFKQLAVPLKKP